MRALILAGLLLVGGCSAERRVEAPTNAAEENMTDANMMGEASNTMENAANAMENAANAAGNGTANGTGNVTVRMARFCPILKRVASEADCAAITEQANALEQGLGAFNVPGTMVTNQPVAVRFAVGRPEAAAETAANAGGTIAKTIQVETKLGRYMTARLIGAPFKIEPQGPAERDLGASASEVWEWQVTPQRKGRLELRLEVEVDAADAAGARTNVRKYQKIVAVEVTVTRADAIREKAEQSAKDADLAAKVSKSWAAFFTNAALALGALGALIGAIWYFKIRKPGDAPAPPTEKEQKP